MKNLSFHMHPEGRWSLTPAYDLTFAKGHGWTAQHQMRVQGLTSGIRLEHLVGLAVDLGVSRPERVVDQVRSAVSSWSARASEVHVGPEAVRRVGTELHTRDREVFG